MHRAFVVCIATGLASPAWAASGQFFSLQNTNFVVLIAFLIFVGVLIYLKVPGLLGRLLDKRADNIRAELDEARSLREEAQKLLASYERKQREVQEQAERIIVQAREEARLAAEQAKEEIAASVARRVRAADEQISSAEKRAIKDLRDKAVIVAVAAAKDVIAKQMTATDGNQLIDQAIADVEAKLH